MIVHYLPSPVDRGTVTGKKPGKGDIEEERRPEESAPFSAMVFKTIADPYAGRLTLFRGLFRHTQFRRSYPITPLVKLAERFSSIFFPGRQKPKTGRVPCTGGLPSWQS